MKKWIRVKRLVNDGELSKAAREIDWAGVAWPTRWVVNELEKKYPKRKEQVKWPKDEEIRKELEEARKDERPTLIIKNWEKSRAVEQENIDMEGDEKLLVISDESQKRKDSDKLEEKLSRTCITSESIEKVVKRLKNSIST